MIAFIGHISKSVWMDTPLIDQEPIKTVLFDDWQALKILLVDCVFKGLLQRLSRSFWSVKRVTLAPTLVVFPRVSGLKNNNSGPLSDLIYFVKV